MFNYIESAALSANLNCDSVLNLMFILMLGKSAYWLKLHTGAVLWYFVVLCKNQRCCRDFLFQTYSAISVLLWVYLGYLDINYDELWCETL